MSGCERKSIGVVDQLLLSLSLNKCWWDVSVFDVMVEAMVVAV